MGGNHPQVHPDFLFHFLPFFGFVSCFRFLRFIDETTIFFDRGKSNIIVKKERGNGASGVFLYSNLFVLVKKYSVAA